MATIINDSCAVLNIRTSGTGVIGITGKSMSLRGIYNTSASAQGIVLFSGTAAVTMAWVTLPARLYSPFPIAAPGGLTYQTVGNPGDAVIGLTFFWIPETTS